MKSTFYSTTLLFLSISLTACSYLFGKSAVQTHPQYTSAKNPGSISIERILVNGETWAENYSVPVDSFGLPKPELQGIDSIGFNFELRDDEIRRQLAFSLNPPDDEEEPFSAQAVLVVIDDLATKHPADKIYDTLLQLECPKNNGSPWTKDTITVPIIPREDVVLEQKKKHITLQGTFDIPQTEIPPNPFMICTSDDPTIRRNTEPPARIELRGIRYDIDTEIIFEWCSKGGECYQI